MPILRSVKQIALATLHGKEKAVAPPFLQHLGSTTHVADINTDQFGTFSGEVERKIGALEVAIQKARLGMKALQLPYGLASEGSFGPHPFIPFLPGNTEILAYCDDALGFTLHESLLTQETNYAHAVVSTKNEADSFLQRAGFPKHGVIVKPYPVQQGTLICKGVVDYDLFEDAFDICRKSSPEGKVWLETDMRAFLNPTRMKVIGKLAEKLAMRLATLCPSCNAPGWGVVDVKKGLPCAWCGSGTEIMKAEIFGCVLCDHKETKPRADGLIKAEPAHCLQCNP